MIVRDSIRRCGCCAMPMNEFHRVTACPACMRCQAEADAVLAALAAREDTERLTGE